MPTYLYKAKTQDKPLVQGTIEADSTAAAVQKLGGMGYFPISLEAHDKAVVVRESSREKIPSGALSASLRQLSDLLEAGIPLITVLEMTAEQSTSEHLQRILTTLAKGVQEGKTLSSLMAHVPEVFPPFYTHLVYAGETGGMLGPVLKRLADQAENQDEVRAQTRAALAYPAFIVVVGFFTVCFLLGGIIPRLSALFADFQQSLPLPTRVLLWVSDSFRHYSWLAIPVIAFLWAGWRRLGPRPEWAMKRDQILLRIPGVKRWIMNQEIARFARTLGSLLENGVPVLQALEVAGQTLESAVFRKSVALLQEPVREGRTLSQGLRTSALFPAYVCNLVAVGEEGGKLDQSLLKVAVTYERQAQRDLKTVMSLLEPALILGIGLILGGVVISIMLPIFEINTLIH